MLKTTKNTVSNIKTILSLNQVVLLFMPSINYNDVILNIVKKLDTKSICYISLNKPCVSLNRFFKENKVKVENIAVINTFPEKVPSKIKNCFFVGSLSLLNELSLMIDKYLKNTEYLIFDSLTTLAIYQKKKPVARFVSKIVGKIKAGKTKAIFCALNVKAQEELIKEFCTHVDKVIDLDK